MMNVYFILVYVLWLLYALFACAEERATLGSDPSVDTGGHTAGQGFWLCPFFLPSRWLTILQKLPKPPAPVIPGGPLGPPGVLEQTVGVFPVDLLPFDQQSLNRFFPRVGHA
jgi:hypothetical protein